MKSWYLIHTKPKQERLAREHLERQGYNVYLPLAEVRRRRRGRIMRVIDAMFPRYLFICLSDKTDDWRPIHSTVGVATLVRFGQAPAKIPDALIADLRGRENTEGVHIVTSNHYQEGTKVRIAEGPLEGYEGIFHCHSGNERVILLLEIARHYIKVELQASQIEAT